MRLNQLACSDPVLQKENWRSDLETAGSETITELCPDWRTNPAQQDTYNNIFEEMRKKNPRSDWLGEAASLWLESLPGEFQHESWYPDDAIRVAYRLFLPGPQFEPFMKSLQKRKHPTIVQLVKAHQVATGQVCMAFLVRFQK